MTPCAAARVRSILPFAAWGVAAAACDPGLAADPTPKELAARLRETLTGMRTVEFHYRGTISNREGNFTNDYEWSLDGEKVRLVIHPGRPGDFPQSFWSFDGQYGYSINVDPRRPGFIRYIAKKTTVPESIEELSVPGDWLGMRLRNFDGTLPDLLEREQARVMGSDVRNGLTVYVVDLGTYGNEGIGPWDWIAALCPERDGLPVEIARTPAASHPRREGQLRFSGTIRLTVPKFQEVSDPALRRKRWLPAAMRFEANMQTEDFEVTSVQVNHDIPPNAYVPQPQPGTELIDGTVPGKRTVRVHEPEAAMRQRATALAKEVSAAAGSGGGAITVAGPPDPGRWWRLVRWAAAAALLAAAAVYVVRSRRMA